MSTPAEMERLKRKESLELERKKKLESIKNKKKNPVPEETNKEEKKEENVSVAIPPSKEEATPGPPDSGLVSAGSKSTVTLERKARLEQLKNSRKSILMKRGSIMGLQNLPVVAPPAPPPAGPSDQPPPPPANVDASPTEPQETSGSPPPPVASSPPPPAPPVSSSSPPPPAPPVASSPPPPGPPGTSSPPLSVPADQPNEIGAQSLIPDQSNQVEQPKEAVMPHPPSDSTLPPPPNAEAPPPPSNISESNPREQSNENDSASQEEKTETKSLSDSHGPPPMVESSKIEPNGHRDPEIFQVEPEPNQTKRDPNPPLYEKQKTKKNEESQFESNIQETPEENSREKIDPKSNGLDSENPKEESTFLAQEKPQPLLERARSLYQSYTAGNLEDQEPFIDVLSKLLLSREINNEPISRVCFTRSAPKLFMRATDILSNPEATFQLKDSMLRVEEFIRILLSESTDEFEGFLLKCADRIEEFKSKLEETDSKMDEDFEKVNSFLSEKTDSVLLFIKERVHIIHKEANAANEAVLNGLKDLNELIQSGNDRGFTSKSHRDAFMEILTSDELHEASLTAKEVPEPRETGQKALSPLKPTGTEYEPTEAFNLLTEKLRSSIQNIEMDAHAPEVIREKLKFSKVQELRNKKEPVRKALANYSSLKSNPKFRAKIQEIQEKIEQAMIEAFSEANLNRVCLSKHSVDLTLSEESIEKAHVKVKNRFENSERRIYSDEEMDENNQKRKKKKKVFEEQDENEPRGRGSEHGSFDRESQSSSMSREKGNYAQRKPDNSQNQSGKENMDGLQYTFSKGLSEKGGSVSQSPVKTGVKSPLKESYGTGVKGEKETREKPEILYDAFSKIQHFKEKIVVISGVKELSKGPIPSERTNSPDEDSKSLDDSNEESEAKGLVINVRNEGIDKKKAGSILRFLRAYPTLRFLKVNLAKTTLVNETLQIIARGIGELVELRFLDVNISGNKITDDGINSLSQELAKLNELVFLRFNFDWNPLNRRAIMYLQEGTKPLKKVKHFGLSARRTSIGKDGGNFTGRIIESFKELTSLSLAFGNSHIGQIGSQTIIKKLPSLSRLNTLKLKLVFPDSWDDNPSEIGRLAECLPSLRTLALQIRSDNKNTQLASQYVAALLSKCKQIDCLILTLKETQMPSSHFSKISSVISKNQRIERLMINIPQQNYNDSDIEAALRPLQRLKKMKEVSLNLKRNFIGKIGAIHLAEIFSGMTEIASIRLNLSCNSIEEIGFNLILDAFRDKPNIKLFSFLASSCGIKGQLLFDFLKTTEKLESLCFRLNHNRITPKSLTSLCEGITDSEKKKLSLLALSLQKTRIGNKGMNKVNMVLEALQSTLTDVRINVKGNGISEETIRETMEALGKAQNLRNVFGNFELNEKVSMDEEEILGKFELAQDLISLDLKFENGENEKEEETQDFE